MIRFENVTKTYGGKVHAVKNINLTINEGEFVVLIGPSGCGKTTTLKLINRLIEKTSGNIYINGREITELSPVELRRGIGYVIQQIGLFPHMTVAGNIGVVPRLLGWPKDKIAARVDELLRSVNMDPDLFRDRYPKDLSGGQQQRVGVLRALAAEPDIILMDEPFGALDPITRDQLQDELKRLQSRLHKTIVFVTHDMDEALKLADRIVIMKDGEIVQVGAPEELLKNPANDFVREFIGKERMIRRPEDVRVDEIMIRRPVTGEARWGLRQGLEAMRRASVDSLLIIDAQKRLQGIVRVEDIHAYFVEKGMEGRLADVMLPPKATVELGKSVREAAEIMVESGAKILPVLDPEEGLVGLITRSSLVDMMVDVLWNPDRTRAEEVSGA